MKLLKNTLFMAFVCLGSLSSSMGYSDEPPSLSNFESRLQQLGSDLHSKEHLHLLFDLYWDWRMANNPALATFMGYTAYNDQWPTLSEEAISDTKSFTNQLLNHLTSIDFNSLSEEDRLNYELFKRSLEESLEELTFQTYYMPINQMGGIHSGLEQLIDAMPKQTVQDYETILKRLNRYQECVDQTIDFMKKGLEAGLTPPKISLQHLPSQILNLIVEEPLESPILNAFKTFPDTISQDVRLQLTERAQESYRNSLRPAFEKLYTYLIQDYIPYCRKSTALSDLPNGSNYYAYLVRTTTTTSLTPDQIHQIGLDEVRRIYGEMIGIMRKVNFQGSFAEFLQFMKTDPQFFFSDKESILKGYQELTKHIETKLPQLFGRLPQLPFEVVPIPNYLEESAIAAYYCDGSLKTNRPGYFFINTSFPQQRAKWEMVPLALHEAVPGHHLQLSLAAEQDNLPEFRKYTGYTSYIEGWGLYSEGLGNDLGLYDDPYSQFGRLTCEMLRAIRLVVDTGLHARGWSREQAIDYFKQYVGMGDHEITTEVDRYLAIPAQALAYKIGELKMLELRHLAEQTLGEHFDIRAFHDEMLKPGAVPLDILENSIRAWINRESNLISFFEKENQIWERELQARAV